jgi:hypothetical protein
VSAYVLHTASPPQHTVLRPGPQLLAAGQQAPPAHATFLGHACTISSSALALTQQTKRRSSGISRWLVVAVKGNCGQQGCMDTGEVNMHQVAL